MNLSDEELAAVGRIRLTLINRVFKEFMETSFHSSNMHSVNKKQLKAIGDMRQAAFLIYELTEGAKRLMSGQPERELDEEGGESFSLHPDFYKFLDEMRQTKQ